MQPPRGPIGPKFVLCDPNSAIPAPSCFVPPEAGQQSAASQQIQPVRVIYSSLILQNQVLLVCPACSILTSAPHRPASFSRIWRKKSFPLLPERKRKDVYLSCFRK